MKKSLFAPAALVATLLGSAGFAQATVTPSLTMDNVVVRAGQSMEFAEVTMDQAGWIVIHDGLEGKPVGASLTQVFVNPGTHQKVLVPLEGGFQAGKEYIISLHHDSNGNGKWDNEANPADDGPIIRADGSAYVVPFLMQPAN